MWHSSLPPVQVVRPVELFGGISGIPTGVYVLGSSFTTYPSKVWRQVRIVGLARYYVADTCAADLLFSMWIDRAPGGDYFWHGSIQWPTLVTEIQLLKDTQDALGWAEVDALYDNLKA